MSKKSLSFQRKYEKKLLPRLFLEKRFLQDHLRREWDEIQTLSRREQLKQRLKDGGEVVGVTVLGLLLVAGVLAVGAVAPNIFCAFGRGKYRKYRGYFKEKSLQDELAYYRKQDYITMIKGEDGECEITEIKLTNSGLKKAVRDVFERMKVPKLEKWDGVWRIIMFDIPEKHRWARDALREKLREMGFFQFQKSVFVLPYPCWDEIEFLCTLYSIKEDYIYYIETSTISNDFKLKEYFSI